MARYKVYIVLYCIVRELSVIMSLVFLYSDSTAPSANSYHNNYSFSNTNGNVELKLLDDTIKLLTEPTITHNKSI